MSIMHLPQITELQALRGNPVIVYSGSIGEDVVPILYKCLRKLGSVDHLDLVLSTKGGRVTTAYRIALLLRDYAQSLSILVPYQVRSAGTLLCLGANELILGPLAELSPIDPQINSSGAPPSDAPGSLSAEDVRAFRQLAEDWFGVKREEDRLQILALISQRIFPTTLSSFYRSDKLIRHLANRLLEYQLPTMEQKNRQQIVEQLVSGYYAHDYTITREEARQLGLEVHSASSQEENLIWDIFEKCNGVLEPADPQEQMLSLIASEDFSARQLGGWADVSSNESIPGRPGQQVKVMESRWVID